MKINIFLLSILVASCFSCEEEQEEYTVDKKASFTAEIDGRTVTIIESDSLTHDDTCIICNNAGSRSYGTQDNVIEIWGMELGPIREDLIIKNTISVKFVSHFAESLYYTTDAISRSLFEQVLSTGDKNYTSNPEDVPGVIIDWYDSNGVKWTTNDPSMIDVTGNNFKINQSISQNALSDSIGYIQYLDLSFGCSLYNNDGQSILLKNGKMKLHLRTFSPI